MKTRRLSGMAHVCQVVDTIMGHYIETVWTNPALDNPPRPWFWTPVCTDIQQGDQLLSIVDDDGNTVFSRVRNEHCERVPQIRLAKDPRKEG